MKKVDPNIVMPKCCKSCVRHPDIEKRIPLNPGRLEEIEMNALNGINQICHNQPENGTIICRGIRDYQIEIFYQLGLIKEPTEECLLATMEKTIGK